MDVLMKILKAFLRAILVIALATGLATLVILLTHINVIVSGCVVFAFIIIALTFLFYNM